jgi:hypothetical protein
LLRLSSGSGQTSSEVANPGSGPCSPSSGSSRLTGSEKTHSMPFAASQDPSSFPRLNGNVRYLFASNAPAFTGCTSVPPRFFGTSSSARLLASHPALLEPTERFAAHRARRGSPVSSETTASSRGTGFSGSRRPLRRSRQAEHPTSSEVSESSGTHRRRDSGPVSGYCEFSELFRALRCSWKRNGPNGSHRAFHRVLQRPTPLAGSDPSNSTRAVHTFSGAKAVHFTSTP